MDVFKQLMAARVVEETLRIVRENMAEAEGTVANQAVVILDGVQDIICDENTSDFEKIEQIVSLFEKKRPFLRQLP